MPSPDDLDLLKRFAHERAEDAFSLLVERHVDAVYAVALRQAQGDAHLAQDITQIVFSTLARKAPMLLDRPVLGGWLYRATRFAARDVLRTEIRRRRREREALAMEEIAPAASDGVDWEALRTVLDRSMSELTDADRDAIWMRFFETRSFAEIGDKLRIAENTARMRVERALDRLHAALSRQGIKSTTAAIALALAHQSGLAAPAGLSASVAAHALATLPAATAGASLVALVTTMSKIKLAGVMALGVAVIVPVAMELRANRTLRQESGALGGKNVAELQKENARLAAALAVRGRADPRAAEISRLRARAAVLGARPDGVLDAELRRAADHRDAGRATPEAAHETLVWASLTRNLDALANFVVFADDSAAARSAFMARFGAAVQAKYRTPERLCAAALFGTDGERAVDPRHPDDAFQFLGTDDHVGGDGTRYGQVRVRVWMRTVAGVERELAVRLQPTPAGFAFGSLYLGDAPRKTDAAAELVRASIDLTTGELKGAKR